MHRMIPFIGIVAAILSGIAALSASPAHGQTPAPKLVAPDALVWRGTPLMPGIEAATIAGGQDQPGLYVFRVKMAPGARIPPHTHTDDRNVTVLAGTLWIGIGATFDEAAMTPVPAGAVFLMPAGTPHYVTAKDGEAVYQESGTGPSRTNVLKP